MFFFANFNFAIKMHFNYGQRTKTHKRLCIEGEIRKQIPNHPNIIFLIFDFLARPTYEMVSSCIKDKEVHQLMQYNADSDQNEYRTSLFLIYKNYPSNLQKWMIEKRKNNCQMIDIIRICYEISCGVLHLWNHGFVHRDLKTNNILIDDDGHIVIIDFGMTIKVNSNGIANVDLPGGNSEHLAPEILNSEIPGDVDYSKQPSFALGVLFHEIIMGYHPFTNYPLQAGKKPNISIPLWNSENMNKIKNPIIDPTLIELICNLLSFSSSNRMNLNDCNKILKNLFEKYSNSNELFIYNVKFSHSHFKSNFSWNEEENDKKEFFVFLLSEKYFLNADCYIALCYFNGIGTKKDISKAFKYFKLSADQNCAHAQYKLGYCYLNGIEVESDELLAFKYFSLSANQNHAAAQNNLGDCYLNGIGTKKDELLAYKYFKLSAYQNYPGGLNNLGYCCEYGIGTKIDKLKAFKYHTLSAAQNYAAGQYKLGYCYLNGIGTEIDELLAFKYFKLSADQNYAGAQNNLGYCYLTGIGTKKDESEAFKYYTLSADQNNSDAQYNLGYCYLNGIGIEKDESIAFQYFKLSADQNDATSQYKLGYCYEYGIGTEKDDYEAFKYYSLSAAQNYIDAQNKLNNVISIFKFRKFRYQNI